jgi:hypothetical protein
MIEEQVTSYPNIVDEVENQSPVKTCALLPSAQLVVQELYLLITTLPPNAIAPLNPQLLILRMQ